MLVYNHSTGHTFVYSNFGYLLLGIIIEALSEKSYEEFVSAEVFAAAHIPRESACIGGNRLSDTKPNEVIYYMSNSIGDPYDLPPMERLAPFAGWVISPINLLKLMVYNDYCVLDSRGILIRFLDETRRLYE